jgi:tripartite-type tricarboxylate transporter receptor subunit TctC
VSSFAHISLCWGSAGVLVVAQKTPIHTAAELVSRIRAQAGRWNYASGGVGTLAHLAGGAFARLLELDAAHVPYRGAGSIVPALLSGEVQFAVPIAATAVPAVTQGLVRPLAVTSEDRFAALPDVPTLKELFRDPLLVQEAWGGLWAPRGTPAPVLERLFAANAASLAGKEIRDYFAAHAVDLEVSRSMQEFSKFVAAEEQKWRDVLKLLGLLKS